MSPDRVMAIYRIDPLHDPRWDDFLEEHPRASVFHTRAWLQALRATYGYEPVAFTNTVPGTALTNAIVFCRIKSFLTGSRLVSVPFADHCDPLVGSPVDPAKPLPRICDVLGPYLGYNTNSMPTTLTVFRCPKDKLNYFEREGSSYQWEYVMNSRPIETRSERSALMYDYENFHFGGTNGTKFVLFGDGHAAKL